MNIAIFASGTGSNAKKIIEYLKPNARIFVKLIISNKADAPVLLMAQRYGIETLVIDKTYFYRSNEILGFFLEKNINFIVLAGFLWLIPAYLVQAFSRRIINIHPALLPKYGGKGMYGMHVHEAVKQANELETGITIHFVNEHYDEGDVIFQAKCTVEAADMPQDIARKVQNLEHLYFPKIVTEICEKLVE